MMVNRPFMDRGSVYDYSSVQVNVPQVIADNIIGWGRKNVPDRDLYGIKDPTLGREDEIHVTILYGIYSAIPLRVKSLISDFASFTITLGEISTFTTNSSFDVIKIEVVSPHLFYLNKLLKENVESVQLFPTYKPHVTIAYINKNVGEYLVGSKDFKGISWTTSTVIFSSKNGQKTPIRLKSE